MDERSEHGVTRRALVRGAGMAIAAGALPSGALARMPIGSAPASPLRVGAWLDAARVDDLGALRAAALGACASRGRCERPLEDEVHPAAKRGDAGVFRVRVLGLAGAKSAREFRLDALHGTARHEAWSLQRRGGSVHPSSPVALRMPSPDGLLRFELADAQARRALDLPARRGVYLADLHGAIDWRRVRFAALDRAKPLARTLVDGDGRAVTAPHLVLVVDAA